MKVYSILNFDRNKWSEIKWNEPMITSILLFFFFTWGYVYLGRGIQLLSSKNRLHMIWPGYKLLCCFNSYLVFSVWKWYDDPYHFAPYIHILFKGTEILILVFWKGL